jgi:BMFP domain-containing protein YqiC
MDPRFIDDLARRLRDAMPPGMGRFREDLEQNFRSVLQGAFAKLDMVTREEFDVQRAVLQRTRQKLERLEKELEKLGTGQPPP